MPKKGHQAPPNWGVMFNDGSVASTWNGRTQKQRAIEARDQLRSQYPNDHITLAYRRDVNSPWERVLVAPRRVFTEGQT